MIHFNSYSEEQRWLFSHCARDIDGSLLDRNVKVHCVLLLMPACIISHSNTVEVIKCNFFNIF